jgi:branched-chain amino acid transport system substrate-binding protein
MMRSSTRRRLLRLMAILAVAAAAPLVGSLPAAAQSGNPIRIGYGMSQTGGLAPNGKSALLAQQLWASDVNAKGGLLGRKVELVVYDDQSNPSTVPGIYTKLLDVDKVDLIIGGYATNMLAPAMPVVIQHNRLFVGLLGLAVNSQFNYPKYFAMIPSGPNPKVAFAKSFFDVAMAQTPKPSSVAIVAADAEFPKNASDGAREIAKSLGLKITYDRSYPPSTTDFTSIVRGIQASNPDIVFVASYPPDSVGMVRAAGEVGLKAKVFGGGMVGLQATSIKTQLGPLLNGIVNYDFWLPVPTMQFPGVADMLKQYQAKAPSEGVDPLGYYMAPWAYAQMQVVQQAVEATKGLDDEKLAAHIRDNSFKTVLGEVKFGAGGEWAQSRLLQVQFQNIKSNDVAQFAEMKNMVILSPPEYKTGEMIYPYTEAKQR